MRTAAIDVLLAAAVLAAWLGAAGFLRLRGALDRLHVVAFVNVLTGIAVTAAALLGDGVSQRSGKIVLIWLLTLVTGAALAHASGRALLLRGSTDADG